MIENLMFLVTHIAILVCSFYLFTHLVRGNFTLGQILAALILICASLGFNFFRKVYKEDLKRKERIEKLTIEKITSCNEKETPNINIFRPDQLRDGFIKDNELLLVVYSSNIFGYRRGFYIKNTETGESEKIEVLDWGVFK